MSRDRRQGARFRAPFYYSTGRGEIFTAKCSGVSDVIKWDVQDILSQSRSRVLNHTCDFNYYTYHRTTDPV